MRIIFHKQFKKKYKKLSEGDKRHFKDRRNMFLENPFHPLLKNHALSGEYSKYRSINITADIRVMYEPIDNETALFITIGTHSELY
jgi:addiction module RelE/StbE family toxin